MAENLACGFGALLIGAAELGLLLRSENLAEGGRRGRRGGGGAGASAGSGFGLGGCITGAGGGGWGAAAAGAGARAGGVGGAGVFRDDLQPPALRAITTHSAKTAGRDVIIVSRV